MTIAFRQSMLALGAAAIALGLAVGVHASTQNTAEGAPPFIGRHGTGPGGPFGEFRMMAERLRLTDAQKEQIKSILQSHKDDWKALADRAATAHKALQDAVTADTIDDELIRQRSAAVAAVEADIAVARAHTRAEIFQVLTPEQQAQAKALHAKMQERVQQGRSRGRAGDGAGAENGGVR